jgi:hypothetical protein
MNVEPNILFTVHEGAPFRRWWCEQSQPTPRGAPFYNAITSLTLSKAKYTLGHVNLAGLDFAVRNLLKAITDAHEKVPHLGSLSMCLF